MEIRENIDIPEGQRYIQKKNRWENLRFARKQEIIFSTCNGKCYFEEGDKFIISYVKICSK